MKTINVNQLTPDSTYFITGQSAFSRVSRLTTKKERDKDNERRRFKIDKDYTTITIYNAQINLKVPGQPSMEENYASECFYKSKSEKYPGWNFTALNKSENLPKVYVKDEKTGEYVRVKLDGEFANGLNVTLIMRVFKGKNGQNNGVSLDTILVNEPLRHFENNVVTKEMEARGIIFRDELPKDDITPAEDPDAAPATTAAPAQPAQPAQTPQNEPVADNASMFSSSAAPAAPVGGDNPFNNGPVNQQPTAGAGRQY
jgi:hypothetical protein